MNPHFREALAALRDASEAMQTAHAALSRAVEAALEANAEHNDLRETVERLESTVLHLVSEVQALRREREEGGAR